MLYQVLAYISVFLMFLPAFSFPVGTKAVSFFIVSIATYFIFFIIFHRKSFIKHIIFLLRKTPFLNFAFFMFWIIVSSLLLMICGKYPVLRFLYYLTCYVVISMCLPILLPTIIVQKKTHLLILIKFITCALYIIFILGIFNFIGSVFDITLVKLIFKFLVNQRELLDSSTVSVYGTKVYSVFAEPGWYAGFICLFLPIVYFISNSKYKVLKNNVLNIVIKKTIFLLALLNLIMTKSPIWLIVGFILVLILYLKRIKQVLLKNKLKSFVIFVLILLISSIGTYKILMSSESEGNNRYLVRIKYTIETIQKLDYYSLVIGEDSLASRINSYYNALRLFADYPITGIGIGNSKYYMIGKFETSKLPLTTENLRYLRLAYYTHNLKFNSALIYQLLSETGIVGCVLYYLFIIKTYIFLNKHLNYFQGICKSFLCGCKISLLLILCFYSIYDIDLGNPFVWFLLGIILALKKVIIKNKFVK